MSLYTMSAVQAIFSNYPFAMFVFSLTIFAINISQVLRIRRLIHITAIGEALELARIVPTQAGVISNKLIDVYLRIAWQLTIIISVFYIATPFIPLGREWWAPIVWPTLFILTGVALGSFGRRLFQVALALELLALIFAFSSAMLPQINAQLRVGEFFSRFIKADLADDINAIEGLRNSQRDAEIKRDLSEVSEWVQKNPNGKYPDDYSQFLKSVKDGERKTLNEIRYEILHPEVKTQDSSPTAKNGWEKVEEKVVDFSKLKIESFDQKLSFPVIPISLNKKLEAGNYRVRLSGNWIFFMSSGNWKQFPWQGKTYANNLPEYRPDKGKEFCAIILLNNGEDITPVNKEGFILSSQGSVNLSLKINVLMRVDEFYSERIIDRANKLTLSNSEKEPVTITIEREVKS
ncbi:MAG: hypothetical protein WAV16_02130 [Candidatus Moraniibacteriota bacterium]